MFGNYITIPHLLIFVPLLAGVIAFFIDDEQKVKTWSLFTALVTLLVSFAGIYFQRNSDLSGNAFGYEWMKYIGASFAVSLDGTGRILTLLTAISFPIIFAATAGNKYKNPNSFYGLMLLTQSGLMGVFLATDCLLFYFFWELALVPVYFLSSGWGGEKRIQATFKFFIYTFSGSLLMLIGIIYTYLQTAPTNFSEHSFALGAFQNVMIQPDRQDWIFWLFFIAFAIKMPVFPFHTWQPDAYEQSPAAVTMVLSGVMVKMGLFGVIRWLLPIFPAAALKYQGIVIALSVIGIIYASLIAVRQDDLKRLIAYSSIAHIGLMSAALFSAKQLAIEGVMIQMFNHGINVIGLWIVIDLIEKQLDIRKISQLGGIAHKAPFLTIALIIIAFANIALPLTNAFVGELMMFGGLYQYSGWYTVVAGISMILAAVYILTMIQKVFYGEVNAATFTLKEISFNQKATLAIVIGTIFLIGLYPQPLLELTKDSVALIISRFK